MATAYSYTRFSTPEQAKGDSYHRQSQMAREYATKNGLSLDESLTFHDAGVSRFHGDNASPEGALGSFLELARAKQIPRGSYLLVERIDRLSRQNLLDATELLRDIMKMGIIIVVLDSGKEYSWEALKTDPFRTIELQFDLLQGHMESVKKSDRGARAWVSKRAEASNGGRPLTTISPPWLEWKEGRWQIIEERANVVRRIFGDTLQGVGQHALAEALNLECEPPFGLARRTSHREEGRVSVWRRPYVRTILANSSVMGTYVPKVSVRDEETNSRKRIGQEPIANYFPAIVDAEDFRRVQELLSDRGAPLRGKHAGGEVRNIFGRLVRCGDCGAAMILSNKGPNRYLVCETARVGAGCDYRSVRLDRVEVAFMASYETLLGQMPAGTAGAEIDAEMRLVDDALAGLSDQYDNIKNALRRGFSAGLAETLREVEQERDTNRVRMTALLTLREEIASPVVQQKRQQLDEALRADTINRAHINALMRQLFRAVRVEWATDAGGPVAFVFEWKHGGETSLVLAWGRNRAPSTEIDA